MPTARERLNALVRENPNITVRDAVAALGISRQRLHQITKSDGIVLGDARTISRAAPVPDKPKSRERVPITRKAMGGVSELVVAIDLLRRGYDVYRSMTVGGLCDLVAVHRRSGASTRIEVKSAQRGANGRVTYGSTISNAFDVLACVFPDGSIAYEPDILPEL